eukprot:gene34918-46908_t
MASDMAEDEIIKRYRRVNELANKYGVGGQEIEFGLRIVERYQPAVGRQHGLVLDRWKAKDHNRALAELHFMLIAMDAVYRGLKLTAGIAKGEAAAQVKSVDWAVYNDARNHFEHVDDRLYGSKKNAPEPIVDKQGNNRTIEFGLKAGPPQRFEFGTKSIDISESFLARQQEYVDRVLAAL